MNGFEKDLAPFVSILSTDGCCTVIVGCDSVLV
jgi:hypothetical protein